MKSLKLAESSPEQLTSIRRAIALEQIKAAAASISAAPTTDGDALLEHWVDRAQTPAQPVPRKSRAKAEVEVEGAETQPPEPEVAGEPSHDQPNSGARPATEGNQGELPDPPVEGEV